MSRLEQLYEFNQLKDVQHPNITFHVIVLFYCFAITIPILSQNIIDLSDCTFTLIAQIIDLYTIPLFRERSNASRPLQNEFNYVSNE